MAYELRISDWSSDVCSSDLPLKRRGFFLRRRRPLLLAERRELRVHRALKGRPCKTPVQIGLQPRLLGDQASFDTLRSEERRVGKECGSTCRSRGSQYH